MSAAAVPLRRADVTTRVRYVTLALLTIAIGLVVHVTGSAIAPAARDVLGDALWAAMIFWWVGALAPGARVGARAAAAYAICVAVEVSQLWHAPALDAARATTAGQLVLGSGFDPRDLVAYAGGVAVAVALDAAVVRRWWRVGDVTG